MIKMLRHWSSGYNSVEQYTCSMHEALDKSPTITPSKASHFVFLIMILVSEI